MEVVQAAGAGHDVVPLRVVPGGVAGLVSVPGGEEGLPRSRRWPWPPGRWAKAEAGLVLSGRDRRINRPPLRSMVGLTERRRRAWPFSSMRSNSSHRAVVAVYESPALDGKARATEPFSASSWSWRRRSARCASGPSTSRQPLPHAADGAPGPTGTPPLPCAGEEELGGRRMEQHLPQHPSQCRPREAKLPGLEGDEERVVWMWPTASAAPPRSERDPARRRRRQHGRRRSPGSRCTPAAHFELERGRSSALGRTSLRANSGWATRANAWR